MKIMKLKIALAATAIVGLTSSCEDFYANKIASPNSPTEVTPDLLLSTAQVATFANYGGQLARQSGIMTQHIAGTSIGSQTIQVMNYNITELTNGNEWDVIYAGAVVNTDIILRDFGAESPHYAGIAKIVKAMNLAVATDLWGDVPFSEASSGLDGNLNPAYDSQQQIYDKNNGSSIFALLESAISDLNQPASANVQIPGADDFIYGGDVAKWIQLAHSLKARYFNHLSEVDANGSATDALAELADGIASASDNAYMAFGPNGNEQNQWYAYNQARGDYIKMAEFFVDTLEALNDPRLPFYADSLANGDYVGTPKDDVDSIGTSNIGPYLNSLTAEIPLASFSEMKFIEAEAIMRSGGVGAADAYNEAVIASVTRVTGSAPDAAFIAAYASELDATLTMDDIMLQKYIDMFGQIESYTDFRRTGLPALSANPDGNITTIPVRFILPQTERLYNDNAVAPLSLTDPVYWDQ